MDKDVLGFISRFTGGGKRDQVVECFTTGCCYWFADILFRRFHRNRRTIIVYDQTENHFGCLVGTHIYDITGDVTDKYNWDTWASLKDDALRKHIVRDCIDFTE